MLNFLPAALELAGAALILILLTSVGIWAARHRDHLPDFAIRLIAFLGVSMPNFWLAFLLVMAFRCICNGYPRSVTAAGGASFACAVSIAFMSLAINARFLRASMLDVAGQRRVGPGRVCAA
ncbi:ABC transporter permease subunit [Shigella flexneri]